jgi:peptidoglycan/xylan/chitin deacetylase (PgdA/CDA1 family)
MRSHYVLLSLLAFACVEPADGERTASLTGTTIVSLTFDDTLADQYQVGAMVAERGQRATFYVNSTRLARSGYMSRDQVLALQAQGNEIGGHTLSHVDLTTLDEETLEREICDDRNALLAGGFRVTSFAYPFGAENPMVRDVARTCNYNSAREVGGLVSQNGCMGCPYANPIPPLDAYFVHTNESIKTTTPLETIQQYVLQAEQNGGGWVPLVFHHVCDGCASNAVSPSTLEALLDWLVEREPLGTEVATVDEVMGGDVKPPVTDGPAPATLLQNPSLEIDANGDQVPDCWYRGGSGTNTATFTLVGNAADGSVAQRIDMTSFTNGARRLVSRQDNGACAPAATPGHTYTIRAKYIANIQPLVSVYYRTTAGTWKFLSQSARLPTSSSYRDAQYTTPPLPADATGISVGLAITAVGFIIMDDFELVDDQATPPPPSSNLIANASLEIDGNGDQVPDCWYRGGSGTNTATFTLVPNAAEGSVAQRIDITSFTSGARRLVTKQDTGACAPAVLAGHTYTMRAKYIANVQPIFSVYYRNTAGTWQWLSQSARLPTSASYALAEYRSPPLPADATAISVGLAITGVGFIIMDDYELVDDQAAGP